MSSKPTSKFRARDLIRSLNLAKEVFGAVPVIGSTLQGGVGALVEILKIVKKVGDNKERQSILLTHIGTICRILESYTSPQNAQSLRRGPLLYRLEQLSRDISACDSHLEKLKKFHRYEKIYKQDAIAGYIDDIDGIVQKAIQTFELEGGIRQEALLYNIQSVAEKTYAAVNHLVQRTENEILSPDYMDESAPKCLKNTRVDLLNELLEWSHGRMHSEHRIVWMHGAPGSGKSTVSRTVVDKLKGERMHAASFFFSRDRDERRNPQSVFPSIARQLTNFSPDFKTKYHEVQSKYTDGGIQNLELQLKRLISEPLELITTPDRHWVIILDALDECEDKGGAKEILSLLGLYLDKLPHVQFLITSRPEDGIKSSFEELDAASLKPPTQSINLHEIDIKTISDDIRLYLTHELARQEGWSPENQDLDSLTTVANGLFIYAATCVKLIKSATERSEKLRDLIEGNQRGGALLDALNALYLQIVGHALEAMDEGAIEAFRHVIGTIVYLRNPLSIRDLSRLLGMQSSVVHSILVPLHAVILVPTSDSSEIKFYHQSFRDFLVTSPEGLPIEERNIVHNFMFLHDQSEYDTYLAENCFKTFNGVLHYNMSGVDDLTKLNSEISDLSSRRDNHLPPYAQYACLYWSSHVLGSYTVRSSTICERLENWTRTHMLFWLESLSLWGGVHQSISSLNEAERWYKECPSPRDEIIQLLMDGQRFVQVFIEPIKSSAGHIYLSALPFTPDCQLRSQYSSDLHESVRVAQGRSKEWTPLLLDIHGPGSWVNSVAFSPDVRRVVSGPGDGTVRVWLLEAGKLLSTLEEHTDLVFSVSFSPDGGRVVSSSYDRTVRIWSSKTGKLLFTLKGHTGGVTSAVFSPDGKRVVSGSGDRTVRVWSSETGGLLSTFKEHTDLVTSVAFSPDGRRVVSGSLDKTARIWSPKNLKLLSTLKEHTDRVYSVAFSPDGGQVVSGSRDKKVRIWSSENGELLSTLEGNAGSISEVNLSLGGDNVAGMDDSNVLHFDFHIDDSGWVRSKKRLLCWLPLRNRPTSSDALEGCMNIVCSGSENGIITILDFSHLIANS